MAKQIVVLESPTPNSIRVVLWAVVPAARQKFYANAAFTSAYLDASAQELSDLRAGVLTERVTTLDFPAGTTLAQKQAQAQATFTAFQGEITNSNPWTRYGSFFDGATWTAGGAS